MDHFVIAAGAHTDFHSNDPRRFVNSSDFYRWERKNMLSPGANAYAFETLALAEFTPVGPSIVTRQPMRVTTANVYMYQQLGIAGYGGLVPGNMIMQPLVDPYSNSYGT